MLWSSFDLAKIFNVNVDSMWFANGVSIDTRTLQGGDLFFALKGTNSDGNSFVQTAFDKGAVAAVVDRQYNPNDANPNLFRQQDPQMALNLLAIASRARMKGTVVGITGSVGKTTVKEMIGDVVLSLGGGFKSEANLNNTLGVPLNLVRMPSSTRIGVFEAGMSKRGELTHIGKILAPHIVMITNINPAHMANFESLDSVADAKYELAESLKTDGVLILDADNEYTFDMSEKFIKIKKGELITFGNNSDADFRLLSNVDNAHGQNINYLFQGRPNEIQISAIGHHIAKNFVACMALVHVLKIKEKDALEVLRTWTPIDGRGKLHNFKLQGSNFIIIFDESYNSSPFALEICLKNLSNYRVKGRKVAYLGDMLELGRDEKKYHNMICDSLKNLGNVQVVAVGPLMREAMRGLPKGMLLAEFENAQQCVQSLPKLLRPNDILLVKGSKSIHMDSVVHAIKSALSS